MSDEVNDPIPDDAMLVGTLHVDCPEDRCGDTLAIPVHAWLRTDDDGVTYTMTQADNDAVWEHSLLAHPEAHR